jgi:chromosome segregation ATPase
MTRFQLLALLAAGIAFSLPASAKMYKWVDENGTTHYSETVPPRHADKDRSELNKAGRVVKRKEALTPEERLAKEQELAEKRAAEETAREQRRRDKALTSTYSNEKEIELARKRNLQQVEARINSINSQVKMAEGNLAGLEKESEGYKAAGKPIPPSLLEDMKGSQKRLAKLQQDMAKAQEEKDALNARYDADKARYKELTGR